MAEKVTPSRLLVQPSNSQKTHILSSFKMSLVSVFVKRDSNPLKSLLIVGNKFTHEKGLSIHKWSMDMNFKKRVLGDEGGTTMSVEAHIRKKLDECNQALDELPSSSPEYKCELYVSEILEGVLAVLAEQQQVIEDLWKERPIKLRHNRGEFGHAVHEWYEKLGNALGVGVEATHPP